MKECHQRKLRERLSQRLKFQKEVENIYNLIDVAAGKSVFDSNCSACHALDGDAASAAAPPLGNLFGRKAGSTTFAHSK